MHNISVRSGCIYWMLNTLHLLFVDSDRYEEFHNSYGALTVEIVRRHQAHQAQERLVRDFMDKMESLHNGKPYSAKVSLVEKEKGSFLIHVIPGSK